MRRLSVLFFLLGSCIVAESQTGSPNATSLLTYKDSRGRLKRVETRDDWSRKREQILHGMQQAMGKLPDRSILKPPSFTVRDTLRTKSYTRLTISLMAAEQEIVPAYLYVPATKTSNSKFPAMLALHGTGDGGKKLVDGESPLSNRALAKELAERGYVVIAPDYPSMGELKDYNFENDRYQSGTMKAIFNHMRCVDLLETLAFVDKNRIGVIGHSLGGHNSMFVAAFDTRLKVVVSSCGWTLMDYYDIGEEASRRYGGRLGPWAQDRYMPLLRERYQLDAEKIPFDFDEVIGALAPRAFFSNSPSGDANFDVRGVKKGIESARAVYGLYRAEQNLRVHYPDAGHDFPTNIRILSYKFIDSVLSHTPNVHSLDAQLSPYAKSAVIKGVKFDWSSHIRLASGSDNWPVTWAADDHQYLVWGDGGGFGGTNGIGRSSLGVARIEGNWHDFKAANVWGGHNTENPHDIIGKSYGIVSVDGVLYMWVGMFETKSDQFREVKIAHSKDHGASWKFTDWAFTREEGVMMPTVCNYGKDYAGARDEYVYSYLIRFQSYEGPDDYEDKVDWLNCQKPGLIDLVRVPKNKLLERGAYEFFSGMRDGLPTWTRNIMDRKPVFENPAGVGWCINVSYNLGLDRYLLTTEHTETHRGNLGIFDSPNPWGPWTTVCYETNWGEGHFPLNTFFWNFSNKWASEDGKTFSLIFTGRKENDSFNVIRGQFVTD